MRDRKTPTLSALAAALLLFVGVPHTGDAASIRWHKTLQQATAAAVKTNKPIMIEFWADWCEPCQVMDANMFQVSNQFYKKALKTDGAKKNPVAREEIMREIGKNFLELHDGKEAASAFQRCVKEFPNGESRTSCQAGLVEAYGLLGRKIEQ